jgi:hypothetical protein
MYQYNLFCIHRTYFHPKFIFYHPFSRAIIHLSVQFCTEVSEEYFITEFVKTYILILLLEFCQQWNLEMVEIMLYTKLDLEDTKRTRFIREPCTCINGMENFEWKLTETEFVCGC